VLILTDLPFWAILIRYALRLGDATVVLAKIILWAILGNRLRIALRTAPAVTAFLTRWAVNTHIGIAITIYSLTCTVVADIAFISFARAVLIVPALGTLGIQAVLIK
jgi:hypothetical protein